MATRRLNHARAALGRLRESRHAKDVSTARSELAYYVELMAKIVDQTRARIVEGNTAVKGKILSIFEPHTKVVRKGKLRKPNEFGRVVRLDGVEHGLISGYEVVEGNSADVDSWVPALTNHVEIFKKAPRLATGDAGFHSKRNLDFARELGVKHAVIRKPGRLTEEQKRAQRSRPFRKGMRWRTGIEAQIGILKHPFGMDRAVYKRETGFKRHIAGCVLAHNLVALARALARMNADAA
jgi:IS5 family transposase